jgi:hypothetical protein
LKAKNETFGTPKGFENGFITEGVFATLHNKSEPVVDALMSLLLQKSMKIKNWD